MSKRVAAVAFVIAAFMAVGSILILAKPPEKLQPGAALSPISPPASSSVQASTTPPAPTEGVVTSSTVEMSTWKTYSSADVGTFKYPLDWKVSEDTSNGTALLVEIYPVTGGVDDPQALVIWIGGPYGSDAVRNTTVFFKNLVSDFQQASTTVGGMSATRLEGIQNSQAPGSQPYNGQKVIWVLVPPGGINKSFYQFKGNNGSPFFGQILSTFAFISR